MINFCSLLALSPEDVLPAVYLCTNKIAPDHENMVCVFYLLHKLIIPNVFFCPKVQ